MGHKKKNPGGIRSTKKHQGIGERWEKTDNSLPWEELNKQTEKTDQGDNTTEFPETRLNQERE